MSAWLPEVEGWVKALGALVAVVMAVLVPVRSWIVEDRRYRERMLEAARAMAAGRPGTPEGQGRPPPLVSEMKDLAAALRDCAEALREAGAAGQVRGGKRRVRAPGRAVDGG